MVDGFRGTCLDDLDKWWVGRSVGLRNDGLRFSWVTPKCIMCFCIILRLRQTLRPLKKLINPNVFRKLYVNLNLSIYIQCLIDSVCYIRYVFGEFLLSLKVFFPSKKKKKTHQFNHRAAVHSRTKSRKKSGHSSRVGSLVDDRCSQWTTAWQGWLDYPLGFDILCK